MSETITTEEKIFRAAITVFVEKGRYGAKMQEIADRAEINKAMLHYYFRNKDRLYAHVFETVFSRIFGSIHHIFERDIPFAVTLRLFIDEYINLIDSNPKVPMFIMRELGEGADFLKEIVTREMLSNQIMLPHLFIARIKKAVSDGEIRAVDPVQLFMTIIGSSLYFFIAEPMFKIFINKQPDFNRASFLSERKQHIYDLIMNGIKPTPAEK